MKRMYAALTKIPSLACVAAAMLWWAGPAAADGARRN